MFGVLLSGHLTVCGVLPGVDLYRHYGFLEYDAGVLTTRTRRSADSLYRLLWFTEFRTKF
jgi:hypothetical protein